MKTLAILASSLLVKEAIAAPMYETEVQIVTEEIVVTKNIDGSFVTGAPSPVGTFTRQGDEPSSSTVVAQAPSTPAAVSSVVVVPTSSAVVIPSSAKASPSEVKVSTAAVAAVLVQSSAKAVATPITLSTSAAAAKTSSQSAAVISASSSTSSSSGGKRGIAYNTASFVSSFTGSSKVSWAYNWGSGSDGLSASGIEFVPLLWGMKSTFTDAWPAAASSAIASGSKHLMSFNEPDHSAQANLAPADAAAGYKTHMQPFAGKAKLGAPAVTNGGSPMGLTWLSSFMAACTDCTIDFVCIHWYDSAENIAYFKSHVQDAYKAGGNRPLWITEFQAAGTVDQQNAFMKEVLPWLDASDMVERYSWFMANTNAGGLISGEGLSTLGSTFKTS